MNETSPQFGSFLLSGYQSHLLRLAQTVSGNWFGRRFSLILKNIILFKKKTIIDAKVSGLNLRLYMLDNIAERKFLFMPNFFDSYELNLLKNQLISGNTFIDVGANAGIYTLMIAPLVGCKGRIIAIEPNPILVERLRFNLSVNNFEDRVTIEQCGVYDVDQELDLFIDKCNFGESSLLYNNLKDKLTIQCRTLLQILQHNKIEKVDALKVDIEGVEDKVLLSFFSTAPGELYPKIIIVENSPQRWGAELVSGLKNVGYKLLKTTRLNQVWTL